MYDLRHDWGGDLVIGSSGDIGLASGQAVTSQRIYKRLLTNPGDYIWHPEYGGGLSQYVGMPANTAHIEAMVRNQLEQETAVASLPLPEVSAEVVDAANGYVVVDISYTESESSSTVQMLLPVGA